MDAFTITIANMNIGIQCRFGSTKEYFRQYLCSDPADFCIRIAPEDIPREQQLLDEEADREGLRRRIFTEPFLERAIIQRRVAQGALARDILLLHGSTVVVDGYAYLFTAPCGVGKSTHTRLWREVFGSRAVMLNDDRAFLTINTDAVTAYGSPWSGKHGIGTNIHAPLAGICFLERGSENRILPLSPTDGMPFLLPQCFQPEDNAEARVHQLAGVLANTVPLWQMTCTKSPDAAQTAYQAMTNV